MKIRISKPLARWMPALFLLATSAYAQVPVDDQGNVIGDYDSNEDTAFADSAATGNEGIPLRSPAELEELVGPVALYPDDLLAIVLPAATYPLQVVQAARFLDELESNPALKPNPEWDDSIIALVNYPEVVELLNEDLDWTWRLGEAVVAQQSDVVNAVENFRDRAYAAGNLKSDGYQTVEQNDGVIEITPVNEDIIYVPYYEPERVVYYQPRPVYYYYPRPCPVYYYPYPSNYAFHRGYFWGVTTAFSIGWTSNHLRVFHHSYHGHPYYGRSYYDRWWYRRPDIHVHNNVYVRNNAHVSVNRYRSGDHWRSNRNVRLRSTDQRITRNTHYPSQRASTTGTTVNRFVNNSRSVDTTRRVETGTRVNRDRAGNTARRSSQEQMRQTINNVQRERQTEGRDGVNPSERASRQPQQRDVSQRQSSQRQTSQRSTSERRTTQQDIAQQLAAQRDSNRRQSTNHRSQVREPVQRQVVQRQTRAHQSGEREVVRRQNIPRQSVERQSTQRSTAARQATQRQASARQPAERQSRPAERNAERSESSGRSQSSQRGRSAREDSRRR